MMKHCVLQILMVLIFLFQGFSQIILEYGQDSIIVTEPLPGNIFEPRDEPVIFSNIKNGMLKTYSEELKQLGIQFRNGTVNIMYNPVMLSPEPDSLCRERDCTDRSWHSSPIFGVHGKGTKLIYHGPVFKGDNTYTKTSLALFDHGHFIFGKDVVVDLVYPRYGNYTRQLWVFGDGTGTFELEEGFVADRSEQGTTNVSFGSVRLSNVNFVTHNSEAIPHYYMADDENPDLVLRNAHLVFENEPGGRWIVMTNKQHYEGGIQVFTHSEIQTHQNLLLNGWINHWPNKNYRDYGGIVFYNDSLTLTKTGPATLTLDCDLMFNPGSVIDVREGTLVFKKDAFQKYDHTPRNVEHGQHLTLLLAEGAVLQAKTPTLHLHKLVADPGSTVILTPGNQILANEYLFHGNLIIDLEKTNHAGTWQLFDKPVEISEENITLQNLAKKLKVDLSNLKKSGTIELIQSP